MLATLRSALTLLLLLSGLLGLAYPLGMTALARLVAPEAARGSLLERNGTLVGSALIGQHFTAERYFHGRPSATTAPDPQDATKTLDAPYNAAASAASNLGPSAKALVEAVRERAGALGAAPAPRDLVTASASGLDPHISPEAARAQIARVAKARGLSEQQVARLVEGATDRPLAGWIGEPRVNVLRLNLALDNPSP